MFSPEQSGKNDWNGQEQLEYECEDHSGLEIVQKDGRINEHSSMFIGEFGIGHQQ